MNFKEHLIAGAIGSTLLAGGYSFINDSPDKLGSIFALCLVGSLAPDLDTQSKISKITAFCLSLFCLYSIYTKEPYLALIISAGFLFIKSFNHRTWTHVYTLPLVLCLAGYRFDIWYLYPFAAGILIHFFIDCLGPQKILPWQLSSWIKPIKII